MIELKKMRALTMENPHNLGIYWVIGILLVLCSAHIFPKDQDKFVFYINNYIDLDQCNQLYDLNWMEKTV